MNRYQTHIYYLSLILFFSFLACDEKNQFGDSKSRADIDSIFTNIEGIDFDYLSTIQNVQHVLPVKKWLFSDVNMLRDFGGNFNKSFSKSLNDIPGLIYSTYQLLGAGAGGFGPPLRGASQKIHIEDEDDLQMMISNLGTKIVNSNDWDKLPFPLRKEVIQFVYRTADVKLILRQFSEPIMSHLSFELNSNSRDLYKVLFSPWNERELLDFKSIEALEKLDLKKLSFATRVLSEHINAFTRFKDLKISAEFKRCTIHTTAGNILINGVQNDTIQGDYLMVLELGGDDSYIGNNAYAYGKEHPMNIIVDFTGDDQYNSEDGLLVSAILGISTIIDLKGNDQYQTGKPGLAFSLYGSSILYDYSGNDVYMGYDSYSQASAFAGAAMFIDQSGNDIYECSNYSQGFAGTLGAAVFLDAAGDDKYNSKDNAAMDLEGNFIQGAARGRWAEATDGQSLGGGIGIFMDNKGDDHYGAQSFSQGASYYFSLGVFVDREGEDHFNAISHSQGYAAHYSLAGFSDYQGNDSYNVTADSSAITQIIGGGRDNSIGVFSDYGGDDEYFFGNRSAGVGDLVGIGILIDYNGKDSYRWYKNDINSDSQSAGQVIQLKEGMSTGTRLIKPPINFSKGIFIDSNNDGIK